MPEYECQATLLVTAEDENDAYSQISDSGISSGALIGTVLVMNLDPLENTGLEA
jgi:hypothetical protein